MTKTTTIETPAHLGGFKPGGDPATWFPKLWRWLVRELEVGSMIDVGAGEGLTVRYFEMLGVDAVGVEGTEQPDQPRLVQHDYTTGPYDPGRMFDLGWCCEFVEHVDESYEQNWLTTLACGRIVLLTHGEPGQPGHHHVNLHYAPYWVGRLAEHGLYFDEALTIKTRELAAVNPSPWNHYKRSGLAFRRLAPPKPPRDPGKPRRGGSRPETTEPASGAERASEQ